MTPKKPEMTRPLTERLTELTSDLRRTQELAKGGLLPLERRSLAMLEELGLLHCREEDAAVLPQEQAAFESFGAAWERLRSVEEAVRAGDGPSSTHASAIQEMQVQARELKVVLSAPALARAEAAEVEVKRLREKEDGSLATLIQKMGWDRMSIADLELLQRHESLPSLRDLRGAYLQLRTAALAGSPS